MNLILASDFPSTSADRVVEHMRAVGDTPRIAWIPSHTDVHGIAFRQASERFGAFGFTQLECVDIDEDRDHVQIAYLHEFDIICLSGDDAVRFRYNAIRSGLPGKLRACLAAGRLVIGTSGGALLLTPNVSMYRLAGYSVEEVLATRARFDGVGAVQYEVLPHHNRWDAGFLTRVREYSTDVDHDIVGLCDGAAVFHSGAEIGEVTGTVTIYRNGRIINGVVES